LENRQALEKLGTQLGPVPSDFKGNYKYPGHMDYFSKVEEYKEMSEERLNEEISRLEEDIQGIHHSYL